MLERTEVEHAHGTVCSDRGEHVPGGRGPGDVVDFSVVCDQLGDGHAGCDVPDCAGLVREGVGRRRETMKERREGLTVSIEEVTMWVGSSSDQENEVRGAE